MHDVWVIGGIRTLCQLKVLDENRAGRFDLSWKETNLEKPIQRIAIVGTGLIGASWDALSTMHVALTSSRPIQRQMLKRTSATSSTLPGQNSKALGLSSKASIGRLKFTRDMRNAVSGADFVQENGPEPPDFKIKLFTDLDDATPADSIIASSSSGLTMSTIQSRCRRPERCVIGHPFNPPHVIPLVEVVGGTKSSPETIQRAISFYRSIGKKPIHVRKEVVGHVANRLQAALYRDVVHPIAQEVLDVADADVAVCWPLKPAIDGEQSDDS